MERNIFKEEGLLSDVFIDNGSPDSYLLPQDVDSILGNLTNSSIYISDINGSNNDSLLQLYENQSIFGNETIESTEDIAELIQIAVTSIVLGLMILITVIGNVFVIAAIILERNLQNVANYLVASLAVADLFVACLVMPLGAVYEISKGWILGPELCDIWTSCDVLCCTASILHLVAIATDRYWAVTNVDYMHQRTSKRVFTMIFFVWFFAVIVSLAPQFGWKDPEYLERIEQQKCMVSQDVAYQVFATCCTFYVPLLVILVLYWKIYQTARKRIHRRRPRPIDITANNNQPVPQKKKTRLKIRIASKFTNQGKSAASSLGLVEGNSTNTVNTVEDTEFSSNVDSKKGVEVTTTFNNPTNNDEIPVSSTSQITTVSHIVENKSNTDSISNENQNIHENQINPSNIMTNKISTTTATTTTTSSITTSITIPTITTTTTSTSSSTTTTTTTTNNNNLSNGSDNNQMISTIATTNNDNNIIIPPTSQSTVTTLTITLPQHQTPAQQSQQQVQQQQQQQQQHNQITTPLPHNKQNHKLTATEQISKRKETLEAKRERKAAKTLAIITGAFVVCWLPFFLMALLLPLFDFHINDAIASFFLWLGYFNSTLNPVIYTIFSPEFRSAFKRILFGGHRPQHYRSGKM
ncbi:5-hydroxytryptamine receptor isoform X1 [Condylostylus longicornis]|uniref:5-hydroxytryptamine receptor isoform X1 n=1 Tax=Condylostylus longicornis TaxID=2530218 RepID=UPI00244DA18A|nr:5-hydroxytryptamine receptor isoform X1 [Condylostylus longicornis]